MVCIWSSWCHCHLIISCFIKIKIGLTFLVPAYPGCPGKEAVKWMSVFLPCFCYFSVTIPCSNLYFSAVQCILNPMILWTHEVNQPLVTMIDSLFSVVCRLSMADRCQQMSCMSQRVCLMSMVDTSVRTSALQWNLKSQLQSRWMLR